MRHLLTIIGIIAVASCSRPTFSPQFPENDPDALAPALAKVKPRAAQVSNVTGHPLAILVTGNGSRLMAYDLQNERILWQVDDRPTSRVVVGRNVIAYGTGKRRVTARAVENGHHVWTQTLEEGVLLGLAADATTVYAVTGQGLDVAADVAAAKAGEARAIAELAALDAHTGKPRWRRPSVSPLGAPAVRDGLVFVPLRQHALAVIWAKDGSEQARIRSVDDPLLWVRGLPQGVFYGGAAGVFRLDADATAGSREKSSFLSVDLPANLDLNYGRDGYNPILVPYTAYDRNRLLWEMNPGKTLRFANDTVVLHYYRFVFAFDTSDPSRLRLRWAYHHPRHDLVSSGYNGNSLVLVSSVGEWVVIDANTGAVVKTSALAQAVSGATFDLGAYALPKKAATDLPDPAEVLLGMIWDPDRRVAPIRLLCVEQLARLSDDRSISERLVEIVTQHEVDAAVYDKVGEMLVARHDAAAIPIYVKALETRYDYLEQTTPRGLDLLARAVGDLRAPEAVSPLLRHLADPETPLAALTDVVAALIAIGDDAVIAPFRDFLLTYRCAEEFGQAAPVLTMVADRLLDSGNPDEVRLLEFVQKDAHTIEPLRDHLTVSLIKRKLRPASKVSQERTQETDDAS